MSPPDQRLRPGPGGVDDGLPSLPDGEPVLHRWFVLAMLVLVPVALGVIAWALLSIPATDIPPAARRPPGDATVTHPRGDATLNQDRTAEPGPDCAAGIEVIGDDSARASATRALSALCSLARDEQFATVAAGLQRWADEDGVLRFGVFELTGVDDSARLEDGRLVIELNAKFQFEKGARSVPSLVHELSHLAAGSPGTPVSATTELAAARLTIAACERLVLGDDPLRVCTDAEALLAEDDPLAALEAVGYPTEDGG